MVLGLDGRELSSSESRGNRRFEWDLPTFLQKADSVIMSINAAALRDGTEGISATEWHIYTRLAIHCNNIGWREMRLPTGSLEAITGTSRATVTKARKRLAEFGLLRFTPGTAGTRSADGQSHAAVFSLPSRKEMNILCKKYNVPGDYWDAMSNYRDSVKKVRQHLDEPESLKEEETKVVGASVTQPARCGLFGGLVTR